MQTDDANKVLARAIIFHLLSYAASILLVENRFSLALKWLSLVHSHSLSLENKYSFNVLWLSIQSTGMFTYVRSLHASTIFTLTAYLHTRSHTCRALSTSKITLASTLFASAVCIFCNISYCFDRPFNDSFILKTIFDYNSFFKPKKIIFEYTHWMQ